MKTNVLNTALGKKVMADLPARNRCKKCHHNRHKSEFGLRVMARGPDGKPLKVRRQSWCTRCRSNVRY